MKKNQGIIIALLIVCVLASITAVIYIGSDNTAPVISVDESKVKPYSAQQGEDTLKSYATAVDKRDGDVSNSIIIENIYIMPDMTRAKVVYVARDKSNNIAKYNYMIAYQASEEEISSTSNSGEEETLAASQDSVSASQETTAAASVSTDTAAASSSQSEAVQASTAAGSPLMTLTASEATVNKGANFNIMRYIDTITDDKDSYETLSRRVILNGKYNTSVSGDYELEVYCSDTDTNESNRVKFVLHVK